MDLKKINEILINLDSYNLGKKFKAVSTNEDRNFYSTKNQGDTGEKTTIYDIGEGVFLKVTETSDSYGTETGVTSIQFVKAVTKQVQVFETSYE